MGTSFRIASYFYPRPPRGGRRAGRFQSVKTYEFLSTPSARRATRRALIPPSSISYFYPRPPRGGRPWFSSLSLVINYFYPRPPRGGRRCTPWQIWRSSSYFYPRPPRGGRHVAQVEIPGTEYISIHALREEGDCSCCAPSARTSNFYPRPPRGGRPLRFCRAAR